MQSLLAIITLFLQDATAAPAMASSQCELKAKVVSIQERTHTYSPESWRKSWGLSKSIIYFDITLDISQVLGGENCKIETFKSTKFQLKNDEDKSRIIPKKCIQAKTQFSGDEFKIGQWLWDIRDCGENS